MMIFKKKRLKPAEIVKYLKHSSVPDDRFDPVQLRIGIKIEMEHTRSRTVAKVIAKAHLIENPNYYKYLVRMEKQMDRDKHKPKLRRKPR